MAHVVLDVSRKHRNGEGVGAEPITVLVMYDGAEPRDDVVAELARAFARALAVPVSVGTVNDLGGNEFDFLERSVVPPGSA